MLLEPLAIQFDLICRRQLLWGPPFHTQIDPALPDSFSAEFRFLHASGRTGSSWNAGEALVLRPHHRQLQCHHRDHEAGLRMVTWHGLAMEGASCGFFGVFVELPNCASKGTTFIWSTVACPEVRKTSAEMVAIISSSSSQNSLAPSIPTWPLSPAVPEFPQVQSGCLAVRSHWQELAGAFKMIRFLMVYILQSTCFICFEFRDISNFSRYPDLTISTKTSSSSSSPLPIPDPASPINT